MKRALTIFFVLIINNLCFSQNNFTSQNIDTTVFPYGYELPVFPGGDTALNSFFINNFNYSIKIKRDLEKIKSKSWEVHFVVTDEGKVVNLTTDVDYGNTKILYDQQKRFFDSIPHWTTDKHSNEREYSDLIEDYNKKLYSFKIELIRILNSMPDWTPGKHLNKAANINYKILVIDSAGKNDQRYIRVEDVTLRWFTRMREDSTFRNEYQRPPSIDYYNNGVKKAQEKNYIGAIDDFTEALKNNPNDIDALYNRGTMKFKMKDTEGACADWNTIKALGKNDADELLKKYCEKK